jgi:hypothetical protein
MNKKACVIIFIIAHFLLLLHLLLLLLLLLLPPTLRLKESICSKVMGNMFMIVRKYIYLHICYEQESIFEHVKISAKKKKKKDSQKNNKQHTEAVV